ncbi:large ribosomal subunit protein mL39 [Stigmatopora nigra]
MLLKAACRQLQRRLRSTAAAATSATGRVDALVQRNAVFSREASRQRALYPRVEKIEVSMQGPGLDGTLLIMNKGMSTPHSCARHLTEHHVTNSVLALLDGEEAWPLHMPLTRSCSLTLLTFKDNDPTLVNQAYWRSCAALLAQVLETSFKDHLAVELLGTPETPVSSGAFICDLVLDSQLDSWTPSEESLRSLTRGAHQLIFQDLPWEPLEVDPSVALEVFSHSRSQQEAVEEKAARNPKGTVTLYRCGDYVHLSNGPLVSRTGLCFQYEVTAIHNVRGGPEGLQRRRAQGVSLPSQLEAHHTVWRKLRRRAEKPVEVPPPEEWTPPPVSDLTPPPSSSNADDLSNQNKSD